MRQHLLACTALLSAFGAPALAWAQPQTQASASAQDETSVETLVVTARKRNEALQDVPVAVTAFGRADIERYKLNSVDELTRLTPGLQTAESSVSSGGSIALRGIGSGSSNFLGDQAVSINVDGMQVGTLNIRKTAQIDMAQIEVLRGPQALFFGKNSPGGVISFKTADPGFEREIELSAGFEAVSQDTYVQGIVSGPISDQVRVRLVGRYTKLNGYFNLKTVPANGDPLIVPPSVDGYPIGDEYFLRGTIIAEPTENLTINAKLTYYSSDVVGGSATVTQRVVCPFGPPQGQPNFPCVGDRDIYRGGGPAIASVLVPGSPTSDQLGLRDNKQVLATVQADYELTPSLTATSVTGYYWFDEVNAHNTSYGPKATLLVPFLPFEMKQFTQELRLASDFQSSLNFTLGVFFESRDTDGAQDAVFLNGPAPVVVGTERFKQGQTAYSAFGQLIWTPVENLEISGGLRYSKEKKDLQVIVRGADVTDRLQTDDLSFSNVSPEITGSYRFSPDLMAFVSYKRGFKSGGFDGGFTNGAIGRSPLGSFRNTFDEENVEGFEGGLKGSFGRSVSYSLTAYRYDYKDLQVGAFDPPTISFKVLNAAAAQIQGLEFEGNWRTPVRGLSVRGSAAYNDAKFEDFLSGCYVGQTPAGGCNLTPNAAGVFLEQDLSGRRLNNAPPFTAYVGALYTFSPTDGINIDLTLDAEYSDGYSANLRQSPYDRQSAFTKLNAGVRVFDATRKWEASLLARNLTNEFIFASSSTVTFTGSGTGTAAGRIGDTSANVTRGREVLMSLAYRF
ncbi:MAG: TonB-dependent receptor [Phenylobacterium sp.]|nr:TonB-dependent receptor [Phenylobacterium sp.]